MTPATARFLRDGFSFWSVLALVALANGTLGMPLLVSLLGESVARPVSSLTYLALAYPLVFLFFGYIERPDSATHYWVLGAIWAVLTVALEAILFVGILRSSFGRVSEAFTVSGLLEGNLFALELVMLLIAPALFSRVTRKSIANRRPRRAWRSPLRRTSLPAGE